MASPLTLGFDVATPYLAFFAKWNEVVSDILCGAELLDTDREEAMEKEGRAANVCRFEDVV